MDSTDALDVRASGETGARRPSPDPDFGDWLDPEDRDPDRQSLLRSWLAFQATWGLRPRRALALLRRAGDPASALRLGGRPTSITREELEHALELLSRSGARALPVLSPVYPERLRRLTDASPLLHVRGDPELLGTRSVAIVGSRAATRHGLQFAHELAEDLARVGVTVISGLARGIDGAAHRGALEGGGHTIAVQACGPEQIYPRQHQKLAGEILERGAVLTELLPGTPPLPHLFPLRNRLISGLAELVVVVEARERSGSLLTARHALDQGGDVMAVPGPAATPTCVGSNRLLRDGAPLVLSADDVLDALCWPRCARVPQDPPSRQRDPLEERVLQALAHEPCALDVLARRLGCRPDDLALALVRLELERELVRERDGRLHCSPQIRR